jgi:hypothetical protein
MNIEALKLARAAVQAAIEAGVYDDSVTITAMRKLKNERARYDRRIEEATKRPDIGWITGRNGTFEIVRLSIERTGKAVTFDGISRYRGAINGGLIVQTDKAIAEMVRFLQGQGFSVRRRKKALHNHSNRK